MGIGGRGLTLGLVGRIQSGGQDFFFHQIYIKSGEE